MTVRINDNCVSISFSDLNTKLILSSQIFERYETNSATAFLYRLHENHGCLNTMFLTDTFHYGLQSLD